MIRKKKTIYSFLFTIIIIIIIIIILLAFCRLRDSRVREIEKAITHLYFRASYTYASSRTLFLSQQAPHIINNKKIIFKNMYNQIWIFKTLKNYPLS